MYLFILSLHWYRHESGEGVKHALCKKKDAFGNFPLAVGACGSPRFFADGFAYKNIFCSKILIKLISEQTWSQETWKMQERGQNAAESEKMTPEGAEREPKVSQREPKGSQREPKGSQK